MTLLLAGLDTAKREKGKVSENVGKADVASERVCTWSGEGRGGGEVGRIGRV